MSALKFSDIASLLTWSSLIALTHLQLRQFRRRAATSMLTEMILASMIKALMSAKLSEKMECSNYLKEQKELAQPTLQADYCSLLSTLQEARVTQSLVFMRKFQLPRLRTHLSNSSCPPVEEFCSSQIKIFQTRETQSFISKDLLTFFIMVIWRGFNLQRPSEISYMLESGTMRWQDIIEDLTTQ